MYAIIATGGKQYKVAEGDVIKVEKLNAEAGETVTVIVSSMGKGKYEEQEYQVTLKSYDELN